MPAPELRRYLNGLVKTLGVARAYFILTRLSVALIILHGLVSVTWLPSGFVLATLLPWGKRCGCILSVCALGVPL